MRRTRHQPPVVVKPDDDIFPTPEDAAPPVWLVPDTDPAAVVPRPFAYDPYGGLPRREDYDPFNTTGPPPPPHPLDLSPGFRSFRKVVLSTQSWGVQWGEATDTSVKRWVVRAHKGDDREERCSLSQPASSSPQGASSSGDPSTENSERDGVPHAQVAPPPPPPRRALPRPRLPNDALMQHRRYVIRMQRGKDS